MPFHELPRWAEAGARSGVKELLVLGWSQADVVPRFEPDTRLGTRDELAAAVRRCHELGVSVTLDLRIPPVPIDHEWYRKELERYACRDRWGIITTRLGWGRAGTLTEQFGTAEQRAILNPVVPGFRQILEGQIRALAALGIDGVRLHDVFARPMDFNPATGKTPDRASWEGALECIAALQTAGRTGGREFSVDVDPVWDRVLPLSMASSPEAGNPSALQTAVPWLRPTFQVAEPDDFTVVNEAGLAGGRLHIAPSSVEPMGGPSMAGLASYLATVLAAREALHATLVEGSLCGTKGLTIAAGIRSTVFRNAATGLRTAVMINPGSRSIAANLTGFDAPAGRPAVLWQPSEGVKKLDLSVTTILAPDELAIVSEEPALATGGDPSLEAGMGGISPPCRLRIPIRERPSGLEPGRGRVCPWGCAQPFSNGHTQFPGRR